MCKTSHTKCSHEAALKRRFRFTSILASTRHCFCTICLLLCFSMSLHCCCAAAPSNNHNRGDVVTPSFFEESLQEALHMDAATGMIPIEDFDHLLDTLKLGKEHSDDGHDDHDHDHETLKSIETNACYTSHQLLHIYAITPSENATITHLHYDNLTTMFPALVQQQFTGACVDTTPTKNQTSNKPSIEQAYGFGTAAIVVISILPFFFIFIIPSTKRTSYRYIMSALMALSCSTMLGDALLHLMPQALAIHQHGGEGDDDHEHSDDEGTIVISDFVWKQLVVIAALYGFYLFEMLVSGRHHAKMEGPSDGHGHGHSHFPDYGATSKRNSNEKPKSAGQEIESSFSTATTSLSTEPKPSNAEEDVFEQRPSSLSLREAEDRVSDLGAVPVQVCHDDHSNRPSLAQTTIRPSTATLDMDNAVIQIKAPTHHHHHHPETTKGSDKTDDAASETNCCLKIVRECIPKKTMGWMVIVGDAVHNVIDGIAVGAAFSGDIVSGLSTSIAIVCHEVPHEVGDFAALLTAGVSWRGACIWNIIHSILSLGGLYLGLGIGADDAARQWIFALTAGMFIYVALTEMMPELTRVRGKFWTYFAFQNVGLMLGFGLMLIIAIFEEQLVASLEKAFNA